MARTPRTIPDGLSPTTPSPTNSNGLEAANNSTKQRPQPSQQGAAPTAAPDRGDALGHQFARTSAWMRSARPQRVRTGNRNCCPEAQPLIPRGQYPGLNAALDWMRSNVIHSTPGNFVGNVAADVAASPWDVPAGLTNAIIHTAQNYGVNPTAPSYPMAAPHIKADLGATPITDPWGQRAETAAQIAATGGGGLWSRLVNGIFGEAKGEAGSYVGGQVADATDPRLRGRLRDRRRNHAPRAVPGRKAVAPGHRRSSSAIKESAPPKILERRQRPCKA